MPTYLCHGFRWQRRSIRVYVILQNVDDASPEWIVPAKASRSILQSFYGLFEFLPYCSPRGRQTPPGDDSDDDGSRAYNYTNGTPRDRSRSQSQSTAQSRTKQQSPLPPLPITDSNNSPAAPDDDFSAQSWSVVKLLEEYDPRDLTAVSRPYAYVADYAVRIDLSCSVADEILRYEQQQLQSGYPAVSRKKPPGSQQPGGGWLEQLRDELQRGEEIRWYVVVNGDEVRGWADEPAESEPESPSPYSARPEPGYQSQYLQQKQRQQQQQQQQQYYQYHFPYPPQPGRPMPTREQRQHHAQYIHQQLIFEGADREREQLPPPPPLLLQNGADPGGGGRPPTVPEKDYPPVVGALPAPSPATAAAAQKAAPPPLGKKMSMDWGANRPKTPGSKGGGLRRLFARNTSKAGVAYAPS